MVAIIQPIISQAHQGQRLLYREIEIISLMTIKINMSQMN